MRCLTAIVTAGLAYGVLSANLSAEFVIPTFRGLPGATYQEWNSFTTPNGLNSPDVANINPNGSATLQELTGVAFLTSGGNIYSFALATSFDVIVPDYGLGSQAITQVVLQIRTQGSTVDLDSVTFNGQVADSAELLYEEPLGGFGGILRDWKFEWTSVSGNMASNTIQFLADESSMSLDRVAVDIYALENSIPAPVLLQARPYHNSFPGVNKVDQSVGLLQRGTQSQQIDLSNLISSSQGINGVVLDFEDLANLQDIDLEYKWSPQNIVTQHVGDWAGVTVVPEESLLPDAGMNGSDRVLIVWPHGSIVNRYLCVQVIYQESVISELYLGHLKGEMTAGNGTVFSVSYAADLQPIRTLVGTAPNAGGRADVDKNGQIQLADIVAMRSNAAAQLTQLTVPGL